MKETSHKETELLSEFVDLLNKYGESNNEVLDFQKKYQNEIRLSQLMEEAILVYKALDRKKSFKKPS